MQRRHKSILTPEQNFLMEKIDFNKRFFEPILEESDIEKYEGKKKRRNRSKLPRMVVNQMHLSSEPGIVRNLD